MMAIHFPVLLCDSGSGFLFMLILSALTHGIHALKLEFTNARLPSPRYGHSALYDGQDSVYIISGVSSNQTLDLDPQVLRYSIERDEVEVIGLFPEASHGAAALSANGDGDGTSILYFGGWNVDRTTTTSNVYSFSTRTQNVTVVGQLPSPLRFHSLAWDPEQEVAYIFGGVRPSDDDTDAYMATDQILRYQTINHTADIVAHLPEPSHWSSAAWDADTGVAYIFGGYIGPAYTKDILVFNPLEPHMSDRVTKLDTALPYFPQFGNPANDGKEKHVYIFRENLMRFSPADETVEVVPDPASDFEGWPSQLSHAASVYVPRLRRMCLFGGMAQFEDRPDSYGVSDKIMYIDLDPPVEETEPPTSTSTEEPSSTPSTTTSAEPTQEPTSTRPPPLDCTDGQTRIIPNVFCCESFYLCHLGEGTKFECADGQQFDPVRLICDEPAVVQCGLRYGYGYQ